MPEEEKLFYTIGEVAQILGVKPYVLRYWETEFEKLNPQKSVTGQRAYRKKDIQVAQAIKRLLYDEKFTIAGAVQKLEELGEQESSAPLNIPLPTGGGGQVIGEESESSLEGPPPPPTPARSKEKVLELKNLIQSTRLLLKKHGVI